MSIYGLCPMRYKEMERRFVDFGQEQTKLTLLVIVILVLGMVGCGEAAAPPHKRIVKDHPAYPCGPYWNGVGSLDGFLHWIPDGSGLIFGQEGEIWTTDNSGSSLRRIAHSSSDYESAIGSYADVSPNGDKIVYATCEYRTEEAREYGSNPERSKYNFEIAVVDLASGEKQRLTTNVYLDHYPVWSPDGAHIAFIANPRTWGRSIGENSEVYMMRTDGSDVRLLASTLNEVSTGRWETNAIANSLKRSKGEKIEESVEPWLGAVALAPPVWSPVGEHVAFLVGEGPGPNLHDRAVLYTVRPDGSELTRIAEAMFPPSWSPDGNFLVFVRADEEGKAAGVYTARPDGTELAQILATQEPEWVITQVLWSPDGQEILAVSEQRLDFLQPDGSGLRTIDMALDPESLAAGLRPSFGLIAAWSPDSARIAFYVPLHERYEVPLTLYTLARDGKDRRDLVTLDEDGNLAPAKPPQQSE